MPAAPTDRVLVGVEVDYSKQSSSALRLFVSDLRERAIRELPSARPGFSVFEVAELEPFLERLTEEKVWFSVEGNVEPEGEQLGSSPWLRIIHEESQGDSVRVVLEVAGVVSWYLLTQSDWVDIVETAEVHGGVSALRLLSECVIDGKQPLEEVWGKRPKWLAVTNVKTGYTRSPATPGKVGNEVTVRIRGKDYWFPADPAALKKFVQLGKTQNRGKALSWFRRYVRREKRYKGRWPDRGYVIGNKILKKNTVKDEPSRVEGLASGGRLDTFREDMGATLSRQLADLTGLQPSLLSEVAHRLRTESVAAVARRLSVSHEEIEQAAECMRALGVLDEVIA